jgi:hypothetical protein
LLYRCEACDGEPMWRIIRIGDVVTTWACPRHLSQVCEGLQRDFEVTQLAVALYAKAREWAEMSRSFDEVIGTVLADTSAGGVVPVQVTGSSYDVRPHSRACSIYSHPHNPTACAVDCPTCVTEREDYEYRQRESGL